MPENLFNRETQQTLQAMKKLLAEAKVRIEQDTDVRRLIRKRPLASLAAAAGGGMVTGYLAAPRKQAPGQKPAQPPHRTATELLQRQLLFAVAPTLRSFATLAAEAFFREHSVPFLHHKAHTHVPPPSPEPNSSPQPVHSPNTL